MCAHGFVGLHDVRLCFTLTRTCLNHTNVCQLLTCWFGFCWCILGRLVEMEFSISSHSEDGRLTDENDSLFSLSSSLVGSLSEKSYENVNEWIFTM